jgi:hypothetical protein
MSHYARLRFIGRHVAVKTADVAVAAVASPGEEQESAARRALTLLTDEQMQRFLGQGFLVLQPEELGAAFHQAVFENATAEYGPDAEERGSGSHGTTIERVPGLETLIESPTVAGALHSLLGPEYAHGHLGPSGCAFHASGGPGGPGQPFHKDTQRAQICGHRTRAAMVMYYPGGCAADMGPTAIVPSSHILARDGLGLSYGVMDDGPAGAEDRGDWGGLGGRAEILPKIAPGLFEHQVVVQAGSVVIVHEDMVHRGTPRLDEDAFRPMFKWSFMRLHEPTAPTWRHDHATPTPTAADWPALVSPEAGPICESLWRWHLGDGSQVQMQGSDGNANVVANTFLETSVLASARDGDEAERMGAAYALGECGDDASLAILATALCSDDNESARRAGAFGLGVAGDRAVPTLIAVLDKGAEASGLVVGSAAEALGEAAMTPDPAVVTALDKICWVQKRIIAAADGDEVPVFSEDNIHTNGDLRIPVMLPVACRPVSTVLCVTLLAFG